MIQITENVVRVYDEVLSKLKHISSLGIDKASFENSLIGKNYKDITFDKDIDRAHKCFIGDVITTATNDNFIDAKHAVMYPDFLVKTYLSNPYFLFNNSLSLEKTVMMYKKYVLNLKIDCDKEKLDKSYHALNVLQIEKIDLGLGYSFYNLKKLVIGLKTFYNLYNKLIINMVGSGKVSNEEILYLSNLAMNQELEFFDPLEVANEGEFLLKEKDYPHLKKYIKDKYKIDYSDNYISLKMGECSVWLNQDIEKYDNRPLVNINNQETILPISYQLSLKK